MPVIAVLNEKGGAGKTTIATNLSRALQLQGKNVILIDSDPQGSARDWHAAAKEDNELLPVIAMDRPSQFKELSKITSSFDWAFIDGAPRTEELAIAGIKAADMVLIPVSPSPYDIWAAESLVELIKARQEITDGRPKAAFVVSRQIVGSRLSTEVRSALEAYCLPILNSCTSQRVIYPTSAAVGSTVVDDEPNGAAAKEIQDILEELLAWH